MTRVAIRCVLVLFCLLATPTASGQSSAQVYVISGTAPVMSGEQKIATVNKGDEFVVQKTNGPWSLIQVNSPAGAKSGWVHKDHVRPLLLPPARPILPTGRSNTEGIKPAMERLEAASDNGKNVEAIDAAEYVVATCWNHWGSEFDYSIRMEGKLADAYNAAKLQAERFYVRVARYYDAHPTEDPGSRALFYISLGDFYVSQGKYAQAEPQMRRGVELLEQKFGGDHIKTARWRVHLANLYNESGQLTKGLEEMQRCLRAYETHYGKEHVETAKQMINLAEYSSDLGRYQEALDLRLRALAIYEAKLGPNHQDLVWGLTNLGTGYLREMGDLVKAEAAYQRAMKIVEANYGTNALEATQLLFRFGELYRNKGDYSQAEAFYQRCLAIQEAKLGKETLDVAITLRSLGILYDDMHRDQQAVAVYERCIQIRQPRVDPDDPELGHSYLGLASAYRRLGECAKAEPLYQQVMALHESRPEADRDQIGYAYAMNHFADLYQRMQQFEKSESLYVRSLELIERVLGPDHPDTSLAVANLAELYEVQHKDAQAEPLYRRSLKANESRLHENHPTIASDLNHLTLLAATAGRWEEAVATKDRASRITRHHIGRVLPGLTEKEQIDYLQIGDVYFHIGQTIGVRRRDNPAVAARSAEWLINGKAVLHETLAQRTLVARDATQPELAAIVQKLRGVQARLASLANATVPKEEVERRHRQMADLTGQEQELAKQLGQTGSRTAQGGQWVALAAVRKALSKDSVLIDIANIHYFDFAGSRTSQQANPHYVAWIVPPEGQGDVQIIELGSYEKTESVLAEFMKGMDTAAADILDAGEGAAAEQMQRKLKAVADQVLKPLEPEIARYRSWIISADWMLWAIPWSALPLSDGRLAIEAHAIQYVTSGRDLVATDASTSATKQAVVFADPDYDLDPKLVKADVAREKLDTALALRNATSATGAAVPANFSRLPGTAQEAKEVSPRLAALLKSEPQVYTQQQALEGAFKQLKQPQVLVLSTHGFCLLNESLPEGQRIDNPLLRCGLVLAGANRRGSRPADVDDGILTGLEIVGTDLRGTELVVLSACDTAGGEVRIGEGVAGLRQAFQLAGARSVIATHWQIPDHESAELMKSFFTNLSEHQTKADALRNAQLALIKARREQHGAAHPFFWAAFTLTGQ